MIWFLIVSALLLVVIGVAKTSELANELQTLIDHVAEEELSQEDEDPVPAPVAKPIAAKTTIKTVADRFPDLQERFSLKKKGAAQKTVPRVEKAVEPVPAPTLRTPRSAKVAESLSGIFDSAKSSEALLSEILQILVDQGPFQKSALIVVAKDRKSAIVVAARGPSIGTGQKLEITDPLSPIAQCFAKVQSFGNRQAECSPFGSKTFAIAPIDADHDTPVALYADCGNDGSLTFEARRIFRNVVEILNQRLPSIPGGIPVELEG